MDLVKLVDAMLQVFASIGVQAYQAQSVSWTEKKGKKKDTRQKAEIQELSQKGCWEHGVLMSRELLTQKASVLSVLFFLIILLLFIVGLYPVFAIG